jgi:hypothetical protein
MQYVTKTKYSENSFPESSWYRFKAYRIEEGIIRRRGHAPLQEYNPWDVYRQTMGERRTVVTPYSEFLELGRRLQPFWGGATLTGTPHEVEEAIESWCSDWGYPGVLASTAVEIRLPPTAPSRDGAQKQTRYYRFGGEWAYEVTQPVPGKPAPARVIFWRWYLREWTENKISKIRNFFPTVEAAQNYPRPGTPEFHKVYAEPVADFAFACIRFFEAAQAVSNHLRGVSPLIRNQRADDEFVLNESMANLRSLEHGIGPSHILEKRKLEKGKLSVQNESVSLLSSFAVMLFMDLSRGRRVIGCDRCEKIFVSDHQQARFCCDKCRCNEASRRFRASHSPKRVKNPPRPSRTRH